VGEFWQETMAQLARWMARLRREPFNLVFTLTQPVIFLVFFSSMFQRVKWAGYEDVNYRTFALAGIIAFAAFGNALAGGIPLLFDKENGFLTRLLSAPITRSSILVSRFLFVSFVTALQVLIIIGLALVMGATISTGVAGVLALVVISSLLGFGVTILSLALAFSLPSHGTFFALVGTVGVPIVFLSSALAPPEAMPGWMQVVVRLNPISYAVDGMREITIRGFDFAHLGWISLVLVGFDALCLLLGARVLGRRLA
jgi:ABC-2 type transport system permease protein